MELMIRPSTILEGCGSVSLESTKKSTLCKVKTRNLTVNRKKQMKSSPGALKKSKAKPILSTLTTTESLLKLENNCTIVTGIGPTATCQLIMGSVSQEIGMKVTIWQ